MAAFKLPKSFVTVPRALAAVLLVTTAFCLALVAGGVTNASTWTGRAERYGYFSNVFGHSASPYPSTKGPVLPNNDYSQLSMPTSVNTKQKLYNFLHDVYYHGGAYDWYTSYLTGAQVTRWYQTGVSFIVDTMLGRDPGTGHKGLTDADWQELQDDLNNPSVGFNANVAMNTSQFGGNNNDSFYQFGNDDVAWYNYAESGNGIQLTYGGSVVYAIFYQCANPIGNLNGLPAASKWSVTAETSSPQDGKNVLPGATVTWTHSIVNKGPSNLDETINYKYQNQGALGAAFGASHSNTSGAAGRTVGSFNSTYTVQPSDLGGQVCRRTSAAPSAWNDTGSTYSASVCANVPYVYNLTPAATINSGTLTTAEAGQPKTVTYSVTNDGPTQSKPTQWTLTQCKFLPGQAWPSSSSVTTTGNNGVQQFGASSCSFIGGTHTNTFDVGQNSGKNGMSTYTADTDGDTAGTHVCYILSVSPPSSTITSGWRHSVVTCISILKSPKVQVLGGDIRAGTIKTQGPINLGGQYYGSWGQFATIGIDGVSGFASGASLAQGAATNTPGAQQQLTFANTPTLGNFATAPTTPDTSYYDAYLAQATPGSATQGGVVDNGTHKVISIDGNLTITSNITYSGSYANIGDIPRVIYVVSGNIIVDSNVTQIDAWLIAKGTLFTCDTDSAPTIRQLTTNDCNQQLTFNGPVNVNDARLSRTFGADGNDANKGAAAEIFNLAPSNYLSNYSATITSSNIQTVYEKELPPRW